MKQIEPNTEQYTTYQRLQMIRHSILSSAAEACAYKWSDEFSRKELRQRWEGTTGTFFKPTPWRLTKDKAMSLSDNQKTDIFCNWDDNISLIPLWLYNYIADGEEFISILGNTYIKGKDEIDLDTRSGYIAFGWNLKNPIQDAEFEDVKVIENKVKNI